MRTYVHVRTHTSIRRYEYIRLSSIYIRSRARPLHKFYSIYARIYEYNLHPYRIFGILVRTVRISTNYNYSYLPTIQFSNFSIRYLLESFEKLSSHLSIRL